MPGILQLMKENPTLTEEEVRAKYNLYHQVEDSEVYELCRGCGSDEVCNCDECGGYCLSCINGDQDE